MSSISLIRVDQPEESEVPLPKGDTSLGRGSILGCDDKRISRKHGLLQVSEDGIITLVSLHTNPCFYKEQNLDKYAILLKGQNKILHDGDEFSLLPNCYQYCVVVKPEVVGVPSVSLESEMSCATQNTDNNEIRNYITPEDEGTIGHIVQTSVQDNTNVTQNSPYTVSPNQKRVLPEWLINLSRNKPSISTMEFSTPSTSGDITDRKRKVPTDETVTKKVKNDDDKEELSEASIKMETDLPDVSTVHTTTTPTSTPTTVSSRVSGEGKDHQLSSEEDDVKPYISPKKDGYEAEYGAASSTTTETPNRDTNQNAVNVPSREPCFYAATCYRKNPQHRADFSHAGDADYNIKQDLPECPYGTSCYRKNLQHRKDYKHTQQPHAPPMPPPHANGDPSQSNINFYNVTYNTCPRCLNTTFTYWHD